MLHNIILIHNNGIVNHYESEGHQIQFVWNGLMTFTVTEANTCFPGEYKLRNPQISNSIKNYRAVYLDSVRLVKNGRMTYLPFWKFWKHY